MVIFGGLELVAAGYLIHRHSKHKRERRLQQEALVVPPQRGRASSTPSIPEHSGRSHSFDQSYTYNDQKPPNWQRLQPQPQYTYPPVSPLPHTNSLPAGYPVTAWPQQWEQPQPQAPNPHTVPQQPLEPHYTNSQPYHNPYYSTGLPDFSQSTTSLSTHLDVHEQRQQSEVTPTHTSVDDGTTRHVRFAEPGVSDEETRRNEFDDPPPAYKP
ncbi:hypothetical protein AOQ84DRAFT_353362 [Glonium stellatum]|uniref:Uncharacterized protein n=1 Tax=Glonium stellatum TaxID=574774 RepID=A0A8E2F568_9PEZI|nr:hypothetical protein AOQ84DRAFT_353362 [Glonium stellatum]